MYFRVGVRYCGNTNVFRRAWGRANCADVAAALLLLCRMSLKKYAYGSTTRNLQHLYYGLSGFLATVHCLCRRGLLSGRRNSGHSQRVYMDSRAYCAFARIYPYFKRHSSYAFGFHKIFVRRSGERVVA